MRPVLALAIVGGACTEPELDPHRAGTPVPELDGTATNGQTFEDRDGDGVAFDQCPGDREDRDGFKDDDGCPDPDDDLDGVPDHRDACPFEHAPTGDGCPASAE